jgi:hypothetical protein
MMSISKAFEELDILAKEASGNDMFARMSDMQAKGLLSAIKAVYGEARFTEMIAYYNVKLSQG